MAARWVPMTVVTPCTVRGAELGAPMSRPSAADLPELPELSGWSLERPRGGLPGPPAS